MEKAYNRELYLETFRREWALRSTDERAESIGCGWGTKTKVPETPFSSDPKAGEIRIFADWKRPVLGLLLEHSTEGDWTVVPVSEFTVPATDKEILIGNRVYQLWNQQKQSDVFVGRSWVVETVDESSIKDVAEVARNIASGEELRADLLECTGLPIREVNDIRSKYIIAYDLSPKIAKRSWSPFMEYGVVAAACVAFVVIGAWYFGRDVKNMFGVADCAVTGGEASAVGCAATASSWESRHEAIASGWRQKNCAIREESSPIWKERACNLIAESPRSDAFARERFAEFHENEFVETLREPLSTFGLDVDTASYTTFRRYLTDMKRLPPRDSVRLEEYVNYFDYDYEDPTGNVPVAVNCELAGCPWNRAHRLLRVGVQAKRIENDKLPPANLVFLIDVSGSMEWNNGLGMAKTGLKMMTESLREDDYVSIVTYANGTEVRLEPTSGGRKSRICNVIDQLSAAGGTSGGAGLELAYRQAKTHFRKNGNNRVILVTDGDFNIGIQTGSELERYIAEKRDTGVYLTVLGVGHGNYQDGMMKKLANAGNGNYAFLDSMLEAKKVMMTEFGGTLCTVAKDVKLQLEFNPAQVGAYRLLGYECRKLEAKDFNDDKKDAGEMGAGHTMTALYEIVAPGEANDVAKTDPLKYQKTTGVASSELMTVKLRYKEPDGDKSKLIETPIVADAITRKGDASVDFRFAAAVAEAALAIEDSKFKGQATIKGAMDRARKAKGEDLNGYRAEFVRLLEIAELLKTESLHANDLE